MRACIFFFGLFSLFGCAQDTKPSIAEGLDSTLWVQTSTEYAMACQQAYQMAAMHLDAAIADKKWTAAVEQTGEFDKKSPAIILDVDETVLNNILFQGTLINENKSYSDPLWDVWLKEQAATEIPGSLNFIKQARAKGVTVFYVTNRTCLERGGNADPCPQKADTIANLKALGFPDVTPETMFLKKEKATWGSEKEPRRKLIADDYRIIMLFGDDLGDFLPNVKKGPNATPEKRLARASEYSAWWGSRWFMLPNPTYGSWKRVLGEKPASFVKGFR